MFQKITDAVELLNYEYMQTFSVSKETRTCDLQNIMTYLDYYVQEHEVLFVYGREKRKSIHQRYYEMFRRFLDRQLLYDIHHFCFRNRNSYSKTDVDTTFMHMKDEHFN